MQCPDPHFKKRHHKRRVVQKPLVDSIVNNLMPGGQVLFLISPTEQFCIQRCLEYPHLISDPHCISFNNYLY